MRQVEVSWAIVFDAPRRARAFLDALIGDNLDIGRPASVEIIFTRRIRHDTPGTFRIAIDRPAVGPDASGVVLNLFYKHSRIEQYLKDGRRCGSRLPSTRPRPALQRPPAEPRRVAGQGPGLQPAQTGC